MAMEITWDQLDALNPCFLKRYRKYFDGDAPLTAAVAYERGINLSEFMWFLEVTGRQQLAARIALIYTIKVVAPLNTDPRVSGAVSAAWAALSNNPFKFEADNAAAAGGVAEKYANTHKGLSLAGFHAAHAAALCAWAAAALFMPGMGSGCASSAVSDAWIAAEHGGIELPKWIDVLNSVLELHPELGD